MTSRIAYTLLADGGRDRALEPILAWMLRRHRPQADLAYLGFEKRRGNLVKAVAETAARHRPDILFVHRDAPREAGRYARREAVLLPKRLLEIPTDDGSVVRVVPVRMTETWLLIDEPAIRRAAGSPASKVALRLPRLSSLESVRDPKKVLEQALVTASGYASGRRRDRFLRDRVAFAERVSRLIDDFAALLQLPAFQAFDAEVRQRLMRLP